MALRPYHLRSLIPIGLLACGLQVTGSSPATTSSVLDESDAAATLPDGGAGLEGEGGGSVAPSDADACVSIVHRDPVTTWKRLSKVTVENDAVVLLTGSDDHAFGQISLPTALPLTTFKASFRYLAVNPGSGDRGDGFAFAWLATNGDAAKINSGVIGGGLGLPNKLDGVAFIFDTYRNDAITEIGDPEAPFFALVRLEDTETPGDFKWWLKTTARRTTTFDAWHEVVVATEGGLTSVSVDSVVELDKVATTPIANGHFVFGAGSGGASVVSVKVDRFQVELPCP